MKKFILYWYNNPVKEIVSGTDVRDAARNAGHSEYKLNQLLVGWSHEHDDAMVWNNSDTGYWSHKNLQVRTT